MIGRTVFKMPGRQNGWLGPVWKSGGWVSSSMLPIEACSIKAEFPSKSLCSRMMHLNLPPFSLIWISWPVFYKRCSHNMVEERQPPEVRFLEYSFLPCNLLSQNTWRLCCSASQAKYKKIQNQTWESCTACLGVSCFESVPSKFGSSRGRAVRQVNVPWPSA